MPETKHRLVIDTNLWISFLLTKSFQRLDELLSSQTITLLFSRELLDEFLDVAQRHKFDKYFALADLEELMRQIKKNAEFIIVTSIIDKCRDEKDNFLLSLAISGRASIF